MISRRPPAAKSRARARLIHAASPSSADMMYATGFSAPDPFTFVETRGRRLIALGDLEIDRGRREARVDGVVSLSSLLAKARKAGTATDTGGIISCWLRSMKIDAVQVPRDFPLGLARSLEKAGLHVDPVEGLFWPEREIKTASQLKAMRRAMRITESGMARALEVLKASIPGPDGRLRWGGKVLTSEVVRAEADAAVLRAGGVPEGTIVAGGRQACDPHERGRGPLRANQLIIIDIFPRDAGSGYFGDLTRTVVRGLASEAQRALWHVVLEGQKKVLGQIQPGAAGLPIHAGLLEFFHQRGFRTEQRRGRWTGFFHGTGHGLGLEVHEEPRFAAAVFRPGQVFTVEPGLYYPEIGGVRHEDVVVVTPRGCRKISSLPKPLEI